MNGKEMKEMQFTDDELYVLSDAMLTLIRDTNKALRLAHDSKCIQELENLNQKHRKLNEKICMMLQ